MDDRPSGGTPWNAIGMIFTMVYSDSMGFYSDLMGFNGIL